MVVVEEEVEEGVGGGGEKTVHSENHNPSMVFTHWGFVDSEHLQSQQNQRR